MNDNIYLTVRKIIEEYDTNDPRLICEYMGLTLLHADLPVSVRGFFLALHGSRAIVINESIPEEEDLFCIAHELGHAVLHSDVNFFFMCENTHFAPGRLEREADLFAAYLLTGDMPLCVGDSVTSENLSAITGVPPRVIEDLAGKFAGKCN